MLLQNTKGYGMKIIYLILTMKKYRLKVKILLRLLEMISTYCGKATSYKRYHHYHTLEDLSSQPKKIAHSYFCHGLEW